MPKILYRNEAGKRLPSVTTITGSTLGWSGHSLKEWAWREGYEGRYWKDTLTEAGMIGTCAHQMVESDLTETRFNTLGWEQSVIECASVAYKGWQMWKDDHTYEVVATEHMMVSETWQCGGTLDSILSIDNKLTLVDLKTSKGVYSDYLVQVAAYKNFWEELYPEQPIEEVAILHLHKNDVGYSYPSFTELDAAWDIFKMCCQIYKNKKIVDKQLRVAMADFNKEMEIAK